MSSAPRRFSLVSMQPVVLFTTENEARSGTSRVALVGKRRFMSGRIAVSTTVKMSLNSFLRLFFSGRPRFDWSTKSNEETSSGTGRN